MKNLVIIITLLLLILPAISFGATKQVNEQLSEAVFVPSQSPAGQGESSAPSPEKSNPWNQILLNLMNTLSVIVVPTAVGAFIAWIGKKLGWDIPNNVNTALEAAILECIAQINNTYGKDRDNEQLKKMAVQMVKQALPNNLMKALVKKYKTVEAAVEYIYRKSYKK